MVLTQVRTGSSIFSKVIIHDDTLRGSDWNNTQVMPRDIFDTRPTLVKYLNLGTNIPQVEDKNLEDLK